MPIISDTNTVTNSYRYKVFTELYENNISSMNIFLQSANSLTDNDIKLSERLYIPTSKLRGFEKGKVAKAQIQAFKDLLMPSKEKIKVMEFMYDNAVVDMKFLNEAVGDLRGLSPKLKLPKLTKVNG